MVRAIVSYLFTDSPKSDTVDLKYPTWDSFERGIDALNRRVKNGEIKFYNMTGVDENGNYRSSSFNRMR